VSSERRTTNAERVWLAFATSIAGGFASIDGFTNDGEFSWQTTKLADRLLDAWRERFEPPAEEPPPPPRRDDDPGF
jgi:hypothetical protein